MKILVTGGAGYIGSHLVDFLIEKGHEITVLDNLVSGHEWFANSNARFKYYDIRNGDFSFKDFAPDIVFHLAAVSRTPWAVEDPIYTYETNVVGSANILEASRLAGVKKVVLASSNIVYAAQTPYKTSKLAMEQVARDYNDLYDLPTVCLRFSNVAGGKVIRQHPDNVLASLAKSKREKGYITIFGDGDKILRNFTNVLDICEALYRAAGFIEGVGSFAGLDSFESETLNGKTVNIMYKKVRGTEIDIMHPRAWSLNEVAKFFDCEVKYIEARKGDINKLEMTGPEKAELLLDFKAKIGLEGYIKDYVN